MSKFIALLCAATVAASASAVFAADTDSTATTAASASPSATATAEATATATADPEATADASAAPSEEATAAPSEEATEVPSFTDVPADAYYADAVAFCAARGYFNGTTDTEFSPETTMTRAMFATVFARIAEADLTADYELTYTDVTDPFYVPYIAWATQEGIMDGYSDEEFGPNDAITREQAAKMIYSYMSNVEGTELTADKDAAYADIDLVNDWAMPAIEYNTVVGYLLADENGNINPQGELTRADACYAIATAVQALEAAEAPSASPAASEEATEAPSASPAASEEASEAPSASPAASEEATEAPSASPAPSEKAE